MLSILLYHIIVTLICNFTGILFYSILNNKKSVDKPFIVYPIAGLIVVTALAQIVGLFLPVNGYSFFAFVCALTVLFVWNGHRTFFVVRDQIDKLKRLPISPLILIASFWLLIIVFSAGPTMMDDTESYHIQMIKWIHEYGTVPGIANLHERFGFNSSWFATISLFIPTSNSVNFYTSLNGLISVWLSAYLVIRSFSSVNIKSVRFSFLNLGVFSILIISILCWPMTRGNATNANYDFITTFLLIVLFVETTRTIFSGQKFTLESEFVLWPFYLFTVRIINYPLLVLSIVGIIILIKQKSRHKLFVAAVMSLSLIVPFITRNVILSGYPFYPAKLFGFFNVDWKVSENVREDVLTFIKYFNRVSTKHMSIDETKRIPFPSWTITWYHYLFSYDKMVVVPSLLAGAGTIFFLKRIEAALLKFFLLVLLLQLISWFFIAPDPRFVYGVFLCFIFSIFTLFAKTRIFEIKHKIFSSLVILMCLSVVPYSLVKILKGKSYQNFVLPATLPEPPFKEIKINNIIFRIPEKVLNNWNPRCYATEIPCLYIVDPRLELRGKAFQDGFRIHR